MKVLLLALAFSCFVLGGCAAQVITPEYQAELDRQKSVITGWAAEPAVIAAVKAQNAAGPIVGMTNDKWESLSANDPAVKALSSNAVGNWLATRLKSSDIVYTNAFVDNARGEKVAFVNKPALYNHAGTARHDVAFSGKVWQGKPLHDEVSSDKSVHIAVPVLEQGKPIGVLVVGVGALKSTTFVWPWDWKWTADQDKE